MLDAGNCVLHNFIKKRSRDRTLIPETLEKVPNELLIFNQAPTGLGYFSFAIDITTFHSSSVTG